MEDEICLWRLKPLPHRPTDWRGADYLCPDACRQAYAEADRI
jgi:hypothetical protein